MLEESERSLKNKKNRKESNVTKWTIMISRCDTVTSDIHGDVDQERSPGTNTADTPIA